MVQLTLTCSCEKEKEEHLLTSSQKSVGSVGLQDIKKAQNNIASTVLRTPVRSVVEPLKSAPLEDLYVKLENMQLMGSFKIRGALNKLMHLSDEEKENGVIACSAGNHAQGVAFSARRMGVKATIVMPAGSPLVKVMATRSLGAEVVLHGNYFDEAYEKALEIQKEKGMTFVHPYHDPYVIAGQGTLGLEIMDDIPELENIIVPIGGGGLISGIAMAVKTLRPSCKVFGVVSEAAPGMERWFKGQEFQEAKHIPTIADGIAVKRPNREIFEGFIKKYVDDIVQVSDDEVARAIVYLMERVKTVTEGSGAAGFAALLQGKIQLQKGPTCVVLGGGNIDLNTMSRVIETGLRKAGRLSRISVIVDDLPGNLFAITDVLARQSANILEVFHDRVSSELSLRETRIDFAIEVRNQEHLDSVVKDLSSLPTLRWVGSP